MNVAKRLLLLAFGLLALSDATGREPTTVILVSIDGLGADATSWANTPTIDQLRSEGLSAGAMRPVFPTLTFPNHFSIATGKSPAEHGIVFNTFPNRQRDAWYTLYDRTKVEDGSWYTAEPIWVTAGKHGIATASYFFVGTEAEIAGSRPDIFKRYNPRVPGEERVAAVIRWLNLPAAQRPGFITLYFEDVDSASHTYGPQSAEGIAAIEAVDGYLQQLVKGISASPVAERTTLVIVSDHGQAEVNDKPPFVLSQYHDPGDAQIVEGGSYVNVYDAGLADSDALCSRINSAWPNGRCITRRNAPEAWQVTDDGRYPDIMLVADEGFSVLSRPEAADYTTAGDHGWPPESPSMAAFFLAHGPDIDHNRVEQISVFDVHPFVLDLLSLPHEPAALNSYISD